MNYDLKAVLESVLIAVISTLLVVTIYFIPVLNAAILLWPVPLIVVGVRRGIWAGMLALGVAAILIGIIIHPFLGLLAALFNIFLVIFLVWAIKRKFGAFEDIVISSGAVLLSTLLCMRLFSWMAGQSIFEYLGESIRQFVVDTPRPFFNEVIDVYRRMGIVEDSVTNAQLAEMIIEWFKLMFPSILLIFSVVIGGFNFLVVRSILKRLGVAVPHVPVFSEWVLPRGMGRGFLIMFIVGFLGKLLGWERFEIVLVTIYSLFSFIFSIQGLAVGSFFLRIARIPAILRVVILAIAYIFAQTLFAFLGVFEQVLHIRRIYNKWQFR